MKRLDDVFLEKVLKRGRLLITNLSVLLKMSDMYDASNEAMTIAAERFIADLSALIGGELELAVNMAEDSFFIEDIRVRTTVSDIDAFGALGKVLSERGIGTLRFRANLRPEDVIRIAYAIKKGQDAASIQASIDEGLCSVGGQLSARGESGGIDMSDTELVARRAYARGVSAVEEVHRCIKSGKAIYVKKAKRAAQLMVDCILKDDNYMLRLTHRKGFDNYAPFHSVNVAVVSMVMGKRLGLDKHQLSRLGIAALLHDIGKADMPSEIHDDKAAYGPKEMELVMLHPEDGVRYLLSVKGLSEIFLISMLVVYEHHINLDMSGYPEGAARTPNLYSRIVRIADEYDSLTSGKVYTRNAVGPAEAVIAISKESGVLYDPYLVNVFMGMFSPPPAPPAPPGASP